MTIRGVSANYDKRAHAPWPVGIPDFQLNRGKTLMKKTLNNFLLILTTATVASLSMASPSGATLIGAQSFGNELVGGEISVFYSSGANMVSSIGLGGPGEGAANVPNFFTFSVTGDTFLNEWKLTNDSSNDSIVRVVFDLSNTTSQPDPNGPIYSPGVLFDDGKPDPNNTDFGYAGRQGAVYVSGPAIIASGESVLWADPMNAGDEYVMQTISYDGFFPGETSTWLDDTDIVGFETPPELPEPASAGLLLLAVAGISFGGRL